MKKYLSCFLPGLLLAILGGCILLTACNKADTTAIVKRTDLYYQLIRTFITDPAVHQLFSEDQLQRLRDIEKVYLSASNSLKTATDTAPVIYTIVDCGTEICAVLESLDGFPERYKKELPVLRAAMLALRMGVMVNDAGIQGVGAREATKR